MRFEKDSMEFVWNKEAEEEDIRLEEQGKDKDSFMARLCLPAMNAINSNLTFTFIHLTFHSFFFYSKNVDVCKTLDLNLLQFDRDKGLK